MATTRRPATQVRGVSVSFTSPDLESVGRKMLASSDSNALLQAVAVRLRATGDPLAEKVRAGIRRIPSWNLYGTNLRARMLGNVEARPITRSDSVGIRIEMNPGSIGAGLVAAMDSNQKRNVPGRGRVYAFRHPVYGNREKWVNQATYPYFRGTLTRQKKITDLAVHKAVEEVLGTLTP